MSTIIYDDETGICPHCCGEGQIFLDGQPYLCVPCDGTGTVSVPPDDHETGAPLGT
jgi:DnaJ-class molecular chaperone